MELRADTFASRLGLLCGALSLALVTGCLEEPEELDHAPVAGDEDEESPESEEAGDAYERVEFEVGFAEFPSEEDYGPEEEGQGVMSPEHTGSHYSAAYYSTPSNVWFRVYEVQFANNSNCSDLETVGDENSPDWSSFASGTRLYDGWAPYGTYRCIALTLSTEFWWYGRYGSDCYGYNQQYLQTPEGGNTITLYMTTKDLRDASEEMDGAAIYELDRAYKYNSRNFRTRFEMDVWDTVDQDSCKMSAPDFTFDY